MQASRMVQPTKMCFGGSGSRSHEPFPDETFDDESVRVFGGVAGLEGRIARNPSHGSWEILDAYGSNEAHEALLRYVPDADESAGEPGSPAGDLTPLEVGAQGEQAAASYLAHEGYEILERNWTCPVGEADIIALDGSQCVFVEVKSRFERQGTRQMPELAVGAEKQRRYEYIAAQYAAITDVNFIRFDVVAVSIRADGTAKVRHYPDAFGGDL